MYEKPEGGEEMNNQYDIERNPQEVPSDSEVMPGLKEHPVPVTKEKENIDVVDGTIKKYFPDDDEEKRVIH